MADETVDESDLEADEVHESDTDLVFSVLDFLDKFEWTHGPKDVHYR